MIKRKLIVATVALSVLSLGLAGCSSSEDKVSKPAPAKPVVEKVYWPLTGVEAESKDAIEHPALSMKIENVQDARPQVGLEHADIVWEQMVEGGLSRFNVVFHSDLPESAGPMRSVRPMDAGISAPLHGIFACSGGQQPFQDSVSSVVGKFINETIAGNVAQRSADRYPPHNLFLNVNEAVKTFSEGLSKPTDQLEFAKTAKDKLSVDINDNQAKPVNVMNLLFPANLSRWDYNQQEQVFERSDDSTPLVSKDGVRITAKNIIVMRVNVKPNDYDAHVPETIMVGSGNATFAVNGKYIDGTWEKPSVEAPVVFKDAKGKVVKFAQGKTWIELLPVDAGFEIS